MSDATERSPRVGALGAAFLVLAVLGAIAFSAFVLPPDGTWSGDTGIRVLQVETLLRSGSFATPYLGQPFDPENRWNPLSPRYYAWQASGYFPKFSPAYAVLSAGVVSALGPRATAIPAALSLALTVGALWWALTVAGSRFAWAAAPTIILLTPLVFYANELWEHQIATALTMLGTAALLAAARAAADDEGRWRWVVLGGAALGAGLWFRGELYAFIPAVAAAYLVLFRRAWRSLALGLLTAGLVAAPLLVIQQALYGRAEGAQVAVDSPLVLRGSGPEVVVTRMLRQWADTIPGLVVPQGPSLLWAGAALVLGAGAVLACRGRPAGRWLVVAGCATVALLSTANLAFRLAPVDLVASAPLVVAVFLASGQELVGWKGVAFRFLGLTALFYLALAFVTAPSSGGAQHGPRYLLSAYPLLVGCAILAVEDWTRLEDVLLRRVGLAAVGLLAVGSLLVQAAGLRNLLVVRNQYAAIAAQSAALPAGPIVTDLWWLPQVIPAEMTRRPVFLVSDAAGVALLADRLADGGAPAFSFVTSGELVAPVKPPERSSSGRSIVAGPAEAIPERSLVFALYRIQ